MSGGCAPDWESVVLGHQVSRNKLITTAPAADANLHRFAAEGLLYVNNLLLPLRDHQPPCKQAPELRHVRFVRRGGLGH